MGVFFMDKGVGVEESRKRKLFIFYNYFIFNLLQAMPWMNCG